MLWSLSPTSSKPSRQRLGADAACPPAAVTCRLPPRDSSSAALPLVLLPRSQAAFAAAASAAAAPPLPRLAAAGGQRVEGRLRPVAYCELHEYRAIEPRRRRLLAGREQRA